MIGRVHSLESFGTVDGPGIRYVVFMQGCPMRCAYCHNPDTWDISLGSEVSDDGIIAEYKKNEIFYKKGGITVTGGEPLLQIDFLISLFKKAKSEGIHTCIDTSGIAFNKENGDCVRKTEELLSYTDLVILDIKHLDSERHKSLTGCDNKNILDFARFVDLLGVDIWIRRVVVQSLTDDPSELFALGEFIGGLKSLKALDAIPYHTLGAHKYKELGLDYALEGVPNTTKDKAREARAHILEGIKKARNKKMTEN